MYCILLLIFQFPVILQFLRLYRFCFNSYWSIYFPHLLLCCSALDFVSLFCFCLFCLFVCFSHTAQFVESKFPQPEMNPCPLCWKHGANCRITGNSWYRLLFYLLRIIPCCFSWHPVLFTVLHLKNVYHICLSSQQSVNSR